MAIASTQHPIGRCATAYAVAYGEWEARDRGLTATTVTPEPSMRRASSVVNRISPSLEALYAPQ